MDEFKGILKGSLNNGIDSNIILYNECSNMWVFIKKESIYENWNSSRLLQK